MSQIELKRVVLPKTAQVSAERYRKLAALWGIKSKLMKCAFHKWLMLKLHIFKKGLISQVAIDLHRFLSCEGRVHLKLHCVVPFSLKNQTEKSSSSSSCGSFHSVTKAAGWVSQPAGLVRRCDEKGRAWRSSWTRCFGQVLVLSQVELLYGCAELLQVTEQVFQVVVGGALALVL